MMKIDLENELKINKIRFEMIGKHPPTSTRSDYTDSHFETKTVGYELCLIIWFLSNQLDSLRSKLRSDWKRFQLSKSANELAIFIDHLAVYHAYY